MAQECGFFNAQLIDGEYDRVYLAEQFAAYFASFVGNGVFGKSMQKLEVTNNEPPNMAIKVLPGEAWINGWWYRNTEECILNLQIADGVLPRIDAVVLRWGNLERNMWLEVISGEPAVNPKMPVLRRDADYYDLQLGYVNVTAGSVRITQSQIVDTRLNNDVCGLVTGIIDQVDTTDLYNQFNAYFNEFKEVSEEDWLTFKETNEEAWTEWFSSFREFVESLENGELLLQVQSMVDDIFYGITSNEDIDAIIAGTYVETPEILTFLDIATNEEIDAIIGGTYVEQEEEEATEDDITTIVNNAFAE